MVVREQIDRGKVSLISGEGSGHGPFCAGYIGQGMMTGGVAGSVFVSPPTASILAGIRAVAKDSSAGLLVLVINYIRARHGEGQEGGDQGGDVREWGELCPNQHYINFYWFV